MVLPKPCTIDNFYRCCIVINLSDCAARKGCCKRPRHAVDKAGSGDSQSRLYVCVSRLGPCSSVCIRTCSLYDIGSYRANLELSRDFRHLLTISAEAIECLLTDFKIYCEVTHWFIAIQATFHVLDFQRTFSAHSSRDSASPEMFLVFCSKFSPRRMILRAGSLLSVQHPSHSSFLQLWHL